MNFLFNKTTFGYFTLLILSTTSCKKNTKEISIFDPKFEIVNLLDSSSIEYGVISWKISSSKRNTFQSAYQIIASSKKDFKDSTEADLWHSGKILSNESINIAYKGKKPQNYESAFLKIRIWDTKGNCSDWSETTSFSFSLDSNEWKSAKWIGINKIEESENIDKEFTKLSARYLRKEFEITKDVKSAKVYYSGLGWSQLYVNEKKTNEYELSPSASHYGASVYYLADDITDKIKKGTNVIAVVLGNGRLVASRNIYSADVKKYGLPRLILKAVITYQDGSIEIINSDQTWKGTNQGPITENNEYHGEKYDARKELTNWHTAAFDASNWKDVDILTSPGGNLMLQRMPAIKVKKTFPAITITKSNSGNYVIDFGQEITGVLKSKLKGKKGQKIIFKHAQVLEDGGNPFYENVSTHTDEYIFGEKNETNYTPTFTYHGFRYAEIIGLEYEPQLSDFEALHLYNDMNINGTLVTSDKMTNKILSNCQNSIEGNYKNIPMDDPCRDERHGYLGDRVEVMKSESYFFDIESFYTKWLRDIYETQRANGEISQQAPAYWEYYDKTVIWPGGYINFCDILYKQYGRLDLLKLHYPKTKKWWMFTYENYIAKGNFPKEMLGDWVAPPSEKRKIHTENPSRKTNDIYGGAMFFIYYTKLLKNHAQVIGKEADVKYYDEFLSSFIPKVKENFFDKKEMTYGSNTATENILPLAFGVVEAENKEKILYNLIENIDIKFKGHPSGVSGSKFLYRLLAENGFTDKAFEIATQKTYPSYGYMVENGATSIWELWNGNTALPDMNSKNNVMNIGDYPIWVFENIGGIANSENSIGFKTIKMKPSIPNALNFANATYNSKYGTIKSEWKKENLKFKWRISIPCNTKAQVYFPTTDEKSIYDGGKLIIDSKDFKKIGIEKNYVIYEMGSGDYDFECNYDIQNYNIFSDMAKTPTFEFGDTADTKPILININNTEPDSEIRYTLDGSEPTQSSNVFEKPFMVDKFTYIQARTFAKNKKPSFVNKIQIDIYDSSKSGINYKYYLGQFKKIPDFRKLSLEKKGTVENPKIDLIDHRADFWAAEFEGFLNIETKGKYTFYLTSDDGSKFYLNNKLVIDNDGIHGIVEKTYSQVFEKGKYPFKIEYFEGDWGENLIVYIEGPGIRKQFFPKSMISRE